MAPAEDTGDNRTEEDCSGRGNASLLFNGIVLGSPENACFLLPISVAPALEAPEMGIARSTQ